MRNLALIARGFPFPAPAEAAWGGTLSNVTPNAYFFLPMSSPMSCAKWPDAADADTVFTT